MMTSVAAQYQGGTFEVPDKALSSLGIFNIVFWSTFLLCGDLSYSRSSARCGHINQNIFLTWILISARWTVREVDSH